MIVFRKHYTDRCYHPSYIEYLDGISSAFKYELESTLGDFVITPGDYDEWRRVKEYRLVPINYDCIP